MQELPLYREYPSQGVENLGAREGYFDHLAMYCGMAYDKKGNVKPLCSNGANDSLFVWSNESIDQLKKRGGDLKKLQLDAVAYLWELWYDQLLAKSPGFEMLGLRVNNNNKRKQYKEE